MKRNIRLTESQFKNFVGSVVKRALEENCHDYWEDAVFKYYNREKLPKGFTMVGYGVYEDMDGKRYVKNEYGKFEPIEDDF